MCRTIVAVLSQQLEFEEDDWEEYINALFYLKQQIKDQQAVAYLTECLELENICPVCKGSLQEVDNGYEFHPEVDSRQYEQIISLKCENCGRIVQEE